MDALFFKIGSISRACHAAAASHRRTNYRPTRGKAPSAVRTGMAIGPPAPMAVGGGCLRSRGGRAAPSAGIRAH